MTIDANFRSALAALVVAAALTGCGSSDPAAGVSAKIFHESLQLIPATEIARQPPQAPFRALLEWWRLAQYRDAAGALQHFTPAARQAVRAGFGSLIYNDFGPWLQHVRPALLRSETSGSKTTLFLELSIREVLSPTVVRNRSDYVAIPMQRVRGQWLISDPTFYQENAQRVHAQRTQSAKQ
ncbi:MAG: hypothetical protein QOF37_3086 [Thermoleophilaceae bacterium]|jgi:hypothetical protein|nr:hypothetical protein [Thermoleophilaceae bacterium]